VTKLLLELGNTRGATEHTRRALRAGKDRPPEVRDHLELLHAEALLAAEQRLSAGGGNPSLRARALVGAVRAARACGDEAAASANLEILTREFPEVEVP
jgi:Tfp pilus assembly protein PilF